MRNFPRRPGFLDTRGSSVGYSTWARDITGELVHRVWNPGARCEIVHRGVSTTVDNCVQESQTDDIVVTSAATQTDACTSKSSTSSDSETLFVVHTEQVAASSSQGPSQASEQVVASSSRDHVCKSGASSSHMDASQTDEHKWVDPQTEQCSICGFVTDWLDNDLEQYHGRTACAACRSFMRLEETLASIAVEETLTSVDREIIAEKISGINQWIQAKVRVRQSASEQADSVTI